MKTKAELKKEEQEKEWKKMRRKERHTNSFILLKLIFLIIMGFLIFCLAWVLTIMAAYLLGVLFGVVDPDQPNGEQSSGSGALQFGSFIGALFVALWAAIHFGGKLKRMLFGAGHHAAH